MIQTLKNAWRVEEIRKKLLFTLIILLIFRIGNAIPVPYVNTAALQSYFTSLQNTVLGLLNVMSGGAFSQATIFALSIQPYINASHYPASLHCNSGSGTHEQRRRRRRKEKDCLHHPLFHSSDRSSPGLCLLHAHQE